MSSKRTQKIIIPKGAVDPTDTTVIEVPVSLQKEPVVIAKKKSTSATSKPDLYLTALSQTIANSTIGHPRNRTLDQSTSFGESRAVRIPLGVQTIDPVYRPADPQLTLPNLSHTFQDDIEETERTEKEIILSQLEEYQKARRLFLQNTSHVTTKATGTSSSLSNPNLSGIGFKPRPSSNREANFSIDPVSNYDEFIADINGSQRFASSFRPADPRSLVGEEVDRDGRTCPDEISPNQQSILKSTSKKKIYFNDIKDTKSSRDRLPLNQKETAASVLYSREAPAGFSSKSSEQTISIKFPTTSSSRSDYGRSTVDQQSSTNALRARSSSPDKPITLDGRDAFTDRHRETSRPIMTNNVKSDYVYPSKWGPTPTALPDFLFKESEALSTIRGKNVAIERSNPRKQECRRRKKRGDSKSDPYLRTAPYIESDSSDALLGQMGRSYDGATRMGITHSAQANIPTPKSSSYTVVHVPCNICESRHRSTSNLLSTEELEKIRDQFLETRQKLEEILNFATKTTLSTPSVCGRTRPCSSSGNTSGRNESCYCQVTKKTTCSKCFP